MDLCAAVKPQIATELQKMNAEAASFAELWRQAKKRFGLQRHQLEKI